MLSLLRKGRLRRELDANGLNVSFFFLTAYPELFCCISHLQSFPQAHHSRIRLQYR